MTINVVVHLNMAPKSVEELTKIIELLREHGLLSSKKKPRKNKSLNEAAKSSNAALLSARGLTRAPRATKREVLLRTQYVAAHGEVNWRDLAKREEIMKGLGYDIYTGIKIKLKEVPIAPNEEAGLSEENLKAATEAMENGVLIAGMCPQFLQEIASQNKGKANPFDKTDLPNKTEFRANNDSVHLFEVFKHPPELREHEIPIKNDVPLAAAA